MPKKEYSIGDQAEYKLFGEGTILAIEGVENSAKLTIAFEEGRKVIMSTYVKLLK